MAFFRTNEHGQDLAEYCLLVALVALIALGLVAHFSGGIQGIWNSANNTLATGTASHPSSGGSPAGSQPSSGQPSSGQPGGGQSGGATAADRAH